MKTLSLVGIAFFLFTNAFVTGEETSFIAIEAKTGHVIASIGPDLDCQITPCSTFKIPLSLIGYDLCLLRDEENPAWPYTEVNVPLVSHKGTQTPRTWMSLSVVWYSKLLLQKIGKGPLQRYLSLFFYGNQDITGDPGKENGFITAHLSSSLKISPREQVFFLRKFTCRVLQVSSYASRMTEKIIPHQTLDSGWQLFGKTGSGFDLDESHKIAWYVGWIEKADQKFIFALLQKDMDAFPKLEERQKISMKFLHEAGIDI